MTQTAVRKSAKPTAVAAPGRVLEIEVGRNGGALLNKLANARIARLLAEKVENPLKEKVKELWAPTAEAEELKLGDTLLVKANVVVRGKVTMKHRAKSIDLDLLLQAFPEAYEACVSDNVTPQFDPC